MKGHSKIHMCSVRIEELRLYRLLGAKTIQLKDLAKPGSVKSQSLKLRLEDANKRETTVSVPQFTRTHVGYYQLLHNVTTCSEGMNGCKMK